MSNCVVGFRDAKFHACMKVVASVQAFAAARSRIAGASVDAPSIAQARPSASLAGANADAPSSPQVIIL